ncbi:MAG: ribokinase [Propionibacteriaceae bacterium]|jgi:ribokinase|nr:ribokinase [Propionibacteriaceae bacterium]
MRLAVVGSYGAGLTVKAPRLPVAGETLVGTAFSEGPGGKGSNQAVAAARLGAEVSFLTAIGADSIGADALSLWRAEGVDASQVVTITSARTMVALITVEASGENQIIIVPGALEHLAASHVRDFAGQIAAADVLAVSLEIPLDAALAALRVGREAGCTTLLNPAPARPLPDDAWTLIDVLTPNQTEAAALAGLPPGRSADAAELGRTLAARTGGAVVMTLGAEGALLVEGGQTMPIPAWPAGQVVDSTGAGDAFNGALAVALAAGRPLPAAAAFAARAGAHAVTVDEVIPSLPTLAELGGSL